MDNQKKKKKSKSATNSSSKSTTTSKKSNSTVLDKIVIAIRALKGGGPKGISRQAIIKYCKSELDYDNANALKAAFKKGTTNGTLIQEGQSFRVAADPIHDIEEDENEKLIIENINTKKNKKTSSNSNESDNDDDDDGTVMKAEAGDEVTVSYVGTLAENGNQFDKASSFTFLLGAGEVIKGWDRGVVGMKEGDKRKLIVPSKLGYGKRGCGSDIPPNSRLQFIIKMKQIQKS